MELSNTSQSAREADNKDYLTKKESIENTPFYTVEENNECFIALGEFRLPGEFKNKEEALIYIEKQNIDWSFLTAVMGVINEKLHLFRTMNEIIENQNNTEHE